MCALLACALALPAAEPAAGAPRAASAVERLVNKARQARGLSSLRRARSLRRSSRRYACWMLARDYFGHLAFVSAPRKFRWRGEALALTDGHQARWRDAWRGWMRSDPHRRVILSRGYRWLGLGSCKGWMGARRAITWVLHVGRL